MHRCHDNPVVEESSGLDSSLARLWGDRLATCRRHRGLSQADLAARCGVAQQTISKIERGLMVPVDRLKLRLATELDVSPGQLFRWPDPPAPDG